MKGKYGGASDARKRFMAFVWVTPLVYFVFGIVPLGYELTTSIPSELNVSEGILSFEKKGRDTWTKLTNGKGEEIFTCADGFRLSADCLAQERMQKLTNKEAKVFWFKHYAFPLVANSKLIALQVDGVEIISRKKTEEGMVRSKKFGFWACFVMLIFILSISAFFYKKAREICM